MQVMWRTSKKNEDSTVILMHNSPLPCLNRCTGKAGLSHLMPGYSEEVIMAFTESFIACHSGLSCSDLRRSEWVNLLNVHFCMCHHLHSSVKEHKLCTGSGHILHFAKQKPDRCRKVVKLIASSSPPYVLILLEISWATVSAGKWSCQLPQQCQYSGAGPQIHILNKNIVILIQVLYLCWKGK